MKPCTRCRITKPLDEFHIDRSAPSGRQPWCKVCVNEHTKKRYYEDVDASRARRRVDEAKRRADPKTNERMKAQRRVRYHSGGAEKQRATRLALRSQHFFIWRSQLWSRRFRVSVTASQLAILWIRQGGRCALSGRPLGRNAHLDHVIHASKGGPHTIDNLRWLDPNVNEARRALSDDEFHALCGDVATWITEQCLATLRDEELVA